MSVAADATITRASTRMIVVKHPGVSGTYSVFNPFVAINFSTAVAVATVGSSSFGSTSTTGAPNAARVAVYQPPLQQLFGSNSIEVIIRDSGVLTDCPFHLVIHMII
jgi:hypothetical protein